MAFTVTGPTELTGSVERDNPSGQWVASFGNGVFAAFLRNNASTHIQVFPFTVDEDGTVTSGTMSEFNPVSFATFNYKFTSVGIPIHNIVLNAHYDEVVAFSISGLTPSLIQENALTGFTYLVQEDGGTININGGNIVFFLVLTTASPVDLYYILPTTCSSSGVLTQYTLSGSICPGYQLHYDGDQHMTAAQVGENDIVYCLNVTDSGYTNSWMIFVRVTFSGSTGSSITVHPPLACTDTDGRPLAMAGDVDNGRFAVHYRDPSTDYGKIVYGELSGTSSMTFSLPLVYDGGVESYSPGGMTWQKTHQSFTTAINRDDDTDSDVFVSSIVSNVVTPDTVTLENFDSYFYPSIAAVFDEAINRSVYAVFGNGGADTPDSNKIYVFSTQGDPLVVNEFWKSSTLQREF